MKIQYQPYSGRRLHKHLPTFLFIACLGLLVIQKAMAENVFYNNTANTVLFSSPIYSVSDLTVWADDIPFSGSHTVSSFTFGYIVHGPVRTTFRFYGVDPTTGKPGTLFSEVIREFPQGITPEHTVQLTEAEQFLFTAEPGLNLTSKSGGWFSVQFEPLFELSRYGSMLLRQAQGSSQRGMYSITDGYTRYTFDPDGLLPASMYLQISSTQGGGDTPPPADLRLDKLQLTPSRVNAGAVVLGSVRLSGVAPIGGVVVKLSSSNTKYAYPMVSEVTIPAGDNSADFYIATVETLRRKKSVRISASVGNTEITAKLRIEP